MDASIQMATQAKRQKLLGDLERLAGEMGQGSIDALYELWKILAAKRDNEGFDFVREHDPQVFATMWLLKKFVCGELWRAFGAPDATGFPKKDGAFCLEGITRGIGHFIQRALFQHQGDAFASLSAAINAYQDMIDMCDRLFRERKLDKDACVVL